DCTNAGSQSATIQSMADGFVEETLCGLDPGNPGCPTPTPTPTPTATATPVPPAHCMNAIKDGDETDIDCGGPSCFTRCSRGGHWLRRVDCQSGPPCRGTVCM